MKNVYIIIIFLFYFSYSAVAENTIIKSGKYLSRTFENLVPLNLLKEIGKKITKISGKEILFGNTQKKPTHKKRTRNYNPNYKGKKYNKNYRTKNNRFSRNKNFNKKD